MSFLTLIRANVWFAERKFVWRTYTTAEALLTTIKKEIIDKKKFVAVALNADNEIFGVHIAALAEPMTIPIYPSYQAQVALLMSKKTEIPIEYSDFFNVFFSNSVVELLEYTRINDHPIDLLDNR